MLNHQHYALSAVLNLTLRCVVLQIRLTTSTLTIAKISAMVTDAVKSMQETAKAVLPDLDTPDVPNLISQLPSELQSVTFSIDGSLSLVDDGSFTCAHDSSPQTADLHADPRLCVSSNLAGMP